MTTHNNLHHIYDTTDETWQTLLMVAAMGAIAVIVLWFIASPAPLGQ